MSCSPRTRSMILMPRLAWPSAMASLLVLGQDRIERDRPQCIEGNGDDRGFGTDVAAIARMHLHAARAVRDGPHRRVEAALERSGVSDGVQQRAGAGVDGHPPAGLLGQPQAVPRQRVPAQHRHGARIGERRVGQRLELGAQHIGSSSDSDSWSTRCAMLRRSNAASRSIACSGACGAGSASRTPSTNWSQPFCAMASRSAIVPTGARRRHASGRAARRARASSPAPRA